MVYEWRKCDCVKTEKQWSRTDQLTDFYAFGACTSSLHVQRPLLSVCTCTSQKFNDRDWMGWLVLSATLQACQFKLVQDLVFAHTCKHLKLALTDVIILARQRARWNLCDANDYRTLGCLI